MAAHRDQGPLAPARRPPGDPVVMGVKKPLMNLVVDDVYVKRTLQLRIARDDHAPPYLALYTGLFMLADVPERGAALRVVVDPKRPKRVAPAETTEKPESSGRTTWRFTSWHGRGPSEPRYAVYEPGQAAEPADSEDSALPE